jgi:hypothetical protein
MRRSEASAERRARDSSGNSADYAREDTSVWGIPGQARNDNEGMSGIGTDSPVGRSPMRPQSTCGRRKFSEVIEYYPSACARSATKSFASSQPTDSRSMSS